MTRLGRFRLILGVTIALFAIAAGYISYMVVQRQEVLREAARYNVAWATSQALSEFISFEQRVAAHGLPGSGVDTDHVQLRLDILFNRATILRGGDVAMMIASEPEQAATLQAFEALLAEIEPLVAELDRPGVAVDLLKRLAPMENRLKYLAASANQFGGAQVADDQRALLELHWIFSGLALGLVVCGVILIVLLLAQNRAIGRAHDRLRLLTDDLRVAKESAELASDAKSRFLANMSHELRTPLNAIVGFSDMIAQEALGPVGQPRYQEYARDIFRSGTHMTDLINDILTMAKLEAGRFEIEVWPVDLRRHVEATLSIFRGTEMARGSDLAIESAGDWPRIRADERALRQMLLNLLSNAVKFSGPGMPVRIVSRRVESGEISLTVVDRGVGMTPSQAELAVKPFRQVDDRLARKYEGTGLGLSIVKGLIERHGGRLLIASEPGSGSRISLVFPKESVIPVSVARVA
jgi:two-component system, cell cycle sensor histidine kinase PleC